MNKPNSTIESYQSFYDKMIIRRQLRIRKINVMLKNEKYPPLKMRRVGVLFRWNIFYCLYTVRNALSCGDNHNSHCGQWNPYIIALKPSFQLHIMVMLECFMDAYIIVKIKSNFKKSRIISGLKWDRSLCFWSLS